MSHWIHEVPVYECHTELLPAVDFNRVRLAVSRLEPVFRFPLQGLRTLDMILEHDIWVVVDSAHHDIPVLAWTDFETTGRALHEPVPCRLLSYHAHTDKIHDKVMQLVENYLEQRLHPGNGTAPYNPMR